MSEGGGWEVVVTNSTRHGWVMLRKCCGKKFHLMMKWAVYKSNVRLEILYQSEAWCQNEFFEF